MKHQRAIASILLLHGGLGTAWACWIASAYDLSLGFLVPNLSLALLGIVAGVGLLRSQRWAITLGCVFYTVQILQVTSPAFQWSFTLGFHLSVAAGGSAVIGVNLYALAMFFWLASKRRNLVRPDLVTSDEAP
ncbi:hypothetical protein LYSHEL_26270 [Lysobacter helvus]|uniref:Uncharacterized protein n=2 Tax=Lysobacteraceae TaxID=32033 RepID=A0ABM7Q897_9GAMM|nr:MULTISPECIES: hypothetical protein [Lysobacter]BCT93602.1 hypothetical protein LYSCAS_26260 [Lysobacter caseinilyticus]BCT96756.1 hypothetical protein LYSHEL_26270 [Lysobacter helvus]